MLVVVLNPLCPVRFTAIFVYIYFWFSVPNKTISISISISTYTGHTFRYISNEQRQYHAQIMMMY